MPAPFSSVGPRFGDSGQKPDIAAPGVNVVSAGVGTGTGSADFSGTSMATPLVAGAAALTLEGHPSWTDPSTRAGLARAALISTADINEDAHGSRDSSTRSTTVPGSWTRARPPPRRPSLTTADGTEELAFGYQPLAGAWTATKSFTVHNYGASSEGYFVGYVAPLPATIELGLTVNHGSTHVTVPAGGSVSIDVQLSLSASAVAALPTDDTGDPGTMTHVFGHVSLTPDTPGPGVTALSDPVLARAAGDVGCPSADGVPVPVGRRPGLRVGGAG